MCFAIWLLLDAPTLYKSAQAAPLGTRRSVALGILRPVDDVSSALGLSHVVGAADRVMGRTGGGVVQVEGVPVPAGERSHYTSVTRRTSASRGGPSPGASSRDTTSTALGPGGLAALAPPTAQNPLRVLSVGDSLGIDFGQTFVNDLAATGVVNAALDAHVDTGLARPDYFDWPAELRGDLQRYQPEVVVVFLGANDPQNMLTSSGAVSYGTQAWNDAYAARVGQFMQSATAAGARVLWVGMPPMQNPTLTSQMTNLNSIFQSEARRHRGVSYLASWPVLSDARGGYTAFVSDPSGNEVQIREPDGTHLTIGGAELLSQAAIKDMDNLWGLKLQP